MILKAKFGAETCGGGREVHGERLAEVLRCAALELGDGVVGERSQRRGVATQLHGFLQAEESAGNQGADGIRVDGACERRDVKSQRHGGGAYCSCNHQIFLWSLLGRVCGCSA